MGLLGSIGKALGGAAKGALGGGIGGGKAGMVGGAIGGAIDAFTKKGGGSPSTGVLMPRGPLTGDSPVMMDENGLGGKPTMRKPLTTRLTTRKATSGGYKFSGRR